MNSFKMNIKMGDKAISKPKRKRTAFEDKDKEILCLILKQTEGGRLWKIIKEGTGTPHEKFVAWEKVTKLFNEATNNNCDRKQLRQMFERIKEKKKKTSDQLRLDQTKMERNFQKECQKTGGGPPPPDLPAEDGDEEYQLDFDDLTPVETDWNKFTEAEDRENIAPSNKNNRSEVQYPTPMSRPGSTGGRRPSSSMPAPRQGLSPSCSLSTSRALFLPSCSLPAPPPFSSPSFGIRSPSALGQVIRTSTNPSSLEFRRISTFSPTVLNEELPEVNINRVEMFTTNSKEALVVEAVHEPMKKVKKTVKKKMNMNEEAGIYYSEMLVIQKKLARLKERVFLRKLRVEKLKEKLLVKQLNQEGGSVPELIDSDVFNDEDEDLNSEEEFDQED